MITRSESSNLAQILCELESQRQALSARIGRLRPYSRRRIELQARLAEITERELRLSVADSADEGHELDWWQK